MTLCVTLPAPSAAPLRTHQVVSIGSRLRSCCVSDWEELSERVWEMPPVFGTMVSDWEQRNRNCETCTRDGLILDGMGSVLLPHPGLDTRKCIIFRKKPIKLFEQTVSHLQTHSVTCTQQQTTIVWWEIRNLGFEDYFCSKSCHWVIPASHLDP